MVEAMYENSPDFFKQFQKNFRFYVSDTRPTLREHNFVNFCFGVHNCDKFCPVSTHHYHVLVDVENNVELFKKLGIKLYVVPCLFSCYKLLLANTEEFFCTGDIFNKLQKAISLSKVSQLHYPGANIKKRLPYICFSQKQSVACQTDAITHTTLDRFIQVLNGPYAADLLKIIDILLTEFGTLNNDSESRLIKFCFEKKN